MSKAHQAVQETGRESAQVWEEIVQVPPCPTCFQNRSKAFRRPFQAALCWTDVADAELFIAVNVSES